MTLINHEPRSLSISGISVSEEFYESDNCVGTVPAFGSCTIEVQFYGGNNGPLGKLQVMTNSPDGSPPKLNLVGACRIYGC